ncbi:acyl-CoA thioesterase [Halogeometricum luteum]|uniref:Acyl-CoA thioesterase n=1 Tax=Halogeometricum luteum TaxID=2950537 RepID=A0ABU2G4K1_9EURY|nr:acyl-CoA thioesterase [Halogeometricum sp. S3BR5-2]MDS0295213.1 acyl-CoA thioesterase [Halogeometricum sp. S3BR5-2]
MTYERVWTVRFSDADSFGIAHYPRIVDAVHETSDMFMQSIGFPYWEIVEEHGYGLPLVEMNFEFERPVEAGDEVTVELTPDLGTRSVRFEYVARSDGEVAFTGYEQRVCAPADGEGSMELPDDLRAALSEYADADGDGDGSEDD